MAIILRYVDLRVVGFVSVYGLDASHRPVVLTSGGNVDCERNKRKRKKKKKRERKKKGKRK